MSSSNESVRPEDSLSYMSTTQQSVPTAYIKIQNELAPARSPGSHKVRFSDSKHHRNGSLDSADEFQPFSAEHEVNKNDDETSILLQRIPSATLCSNQFSFNVLQSSSSNGLSSSGM